MPVLSRNRPDQPPQDTPALRPWAILAALGLGRVAFGYQFQTVATLGPRLVSLFHLTYAEFGALIGAYMLLGAFVALPLGVLGRWLGDRTVTGVGLGLMVAGACVSAWGGTPASIAAGRVIAGVGGVGTLVPQGKIIADWFTGARLMLAMSIVVCGYPIGVGLAQLALPSVSYGFGWPAGFLSGAVVPGLALVLFLASFSPSPHLAATCHDASRCRPWQECLLVAIAGMIFTAYTAGYSGYFSYVPSTLARRGDRTGADRRGGDDRRLGQHAGDPVRRRPGRALRRLPRPADRHARPGGRHGRHGPVWASRAVVGPGRDRRLDPSRA